MSGVLALAPSPPPINDVITENAGTMVTTFVSLFTAIVPYGATMFALAWGWSTARGMIGAKKKKPT
jgi:hypothetical protein